MIGSRWARDWPPPFGNWGALKFLMQRSRYLYSISSSTKNLSKWHRLNHCFKVLDWKTSQFFPIDMLLVVVRRVIGIGLVDVVVKRFPYFLAVCSSNSCEKRFGLLLLSIEDLEYTGCERLPATRSSSWARACCVLPVYVLFFFGLRTLTCQACCAVPRIVTAMLHFLSGLLTRPPERRISMPVWSPTYEYQASACIHEGADPRLFVAESWFCNWPIEKANFDPSQTCEVDSRGRYFRIRGWKKSRVARWLFP